MRKNTAEKALQVISAWETIAPDSVFGGMTLAQFKERVKPSLDRRDELTTLKAQKTAARDGRDDADKATRRFVEMVVHGVVADPGHGSDSALLEAMGYIRKSERRSGLTRKLQKSTVGATSGS